VLAWFVRRPTGRGGRTAGGPPVGDDRVELGSQQLLVGEHQLEELLLDAGRSAVVSRRERRGRCHHRSQALIAR
jgi:hypothetical protein